MMVASIARQMMREVYMDFAEVSFYLEVTTIAVRKPDPDGRTVSLFIQPFKLEMWGCVVGAAPLVGIVIWLFTCARGAILTQMKMGTMGKIADALWFSFGALFNQGEAFETGCFVYKLNVLKTESFKLRTLFRVQQST